jgi:predicted DNA binding CopG/RHH family protein
MDIIDKTETELIASIENDEWQPFKDSAIVKRQLQAAARSTMLKDQRMNIRIAKRDMESLRARALREGMPYQTLVSSILHKYVTGQLMEKKS